MNKLADKYKIGLDFYNETRFNHDECGDLRGRLYVRKTTKGIVYWCHNCGFSGQIKNTNLSPAEVASALATFRKEQNVTLNSNTIRLPSDFSLDISPKGMIWLYKYGITDEEIKTFGIGYSYYMNRLILPVYNKNNHELIYWQGRNLGVISKDKPKYLNIRNNLVKDIYFTRTLYEKDTPLIIVEDILSAIKVGRSFNTIALLGSYIPSSFYKFIKTNYTPSHIYIWLDEDKYAKSIEYSRMLSEQCSTITKVIHTIKDPKEYNDFSFLTT